MADELTKRALGGSPIAAPAALDDNARSKRARARSAERLAACLATIAGFIDAYGMITFGVFVSFMSGNTTQTGYQAAEGLFGPAGLSGLAILFFVIGSFAGTLLLDAGEERERRLMFGVVAVMLAMIMGFTQLALLSAAAAIASISLAMGIMTRAFSRVGAQPVSPTFVTGTLSGIGSHLALAARRAPLPDAQGPWDTHVRRALLLARVWAGFLAGALLSGVATPRFGAWILAAPALVLAALAVFGRSGDAAD